jgi:phosphoribosyl-ATP pyrophosphohydrolase
MDHEAAPSEALEGGELDVLYATILSRKAHPSPDSYTAQLFEGGADRILKKVVEEAGEFVISAKNGQKEAIAHEAADLLYHLFVALADQGISLRDIETVLRARSSQSGLVEKQARQRASPTKGE